MRETTFGGAVRVRLELVGISERTETIRSREDLRIFLFELITNLRTAPDEWTNDDLPSFLEAIGAWLNDMDGYYMNAGVDSAKLPTWRLFADMLMAAKTYE